MEQREGRGVSAFYDTANRFAGDTFLTLQPNDPWTIGTADLLAVTLLDVAVPASAVRALLPGGDCAEHVTTLLTRIPVGIPLWEADDVALGWASRLWWTVMTVPGMGRTKTGKLLARKRPELVPIVDSIVHSALQCVPNTTWSTLRAVLGDDDLRQQVARLRPGTPILRVLDSVIWMHHSGASSVRGFRLSAGEDDGDEGVTPTP